MSGFEIVGLALSAASGAASTFGAYQQRQQAAAIAEANARQAASSANAKENLIRRSSSRKLAQASVDMASGGFTLASSANLLADMAAEAEVEALAARTEGERAHQYYKLEAKQQRKAAVVEAVAGGLQTAGSVATRGYELWGKAA